MKARSRKITRIKSTPLAPHAELLDEILHQLLECKYFETMTPEVFRLVLKSGSHLDVPANTLLIKENAPDDDMYFLLEGSLAAKSGDKVILRFNSPGDVVGEFAVVSDQPRSADVFTEEDSRLVKVSTGFLHRWSANPKLVVEFYTVFSHIMAAKLRETSSRARLYEDAVMEVREIATAQDKLESDIQDKLNEIRLYSKVIESSHAAVLISDTNGLVINSNPSALQLLTSLEIPFQIGNTKIMDLLQDFDLGNYPQQDFGTPWQGEWSRKEGEDHLVLHATVTPINDSEQHLVNIAFQFVDISLQKAQERDIAAKNQEIQNALLDLEATYQELQRTDLLKTETLNAISNELGGPIRKILNHSGKIKEAGNELEPDELEFNLSAITEQSEYLKIITENINYLIDLQAEMTKVGTIPLDLRDVVNQVSGKLESYAKRSSVTFDIDLPEEPLILSGDEEQFTTVLSLLVEQALLVSRKKTKITIQGSLLAGSEKVQVEIGYHGPTFKNANPSEEPFRGRMGILIGMPLARKVISQYQGTLQFGGNAKKGSIQVILPRVQKIGEERPNRIMIVDSLDMDRMITKGVIDHLWPNSIIMSTDNPFEFLDNYEDFAPDLVIVDPDIRESGWSNHRVVASLTQNRRHMCPILALSGLYKDFAERTIAVERGVNDFLEKPYSIFDLRFKVKSLLHSHRREESLHQNMDQAQRQAYTDGLTRLANRKHFDEFLETQLEYSKQTSKPCSMILLDVDNFKHYNDTNGHQFGDEVLRTIGRILHLSVRTSDLAARYGGEEFAVVLPETRKEMALVVAEKIRRGIQEGKFPNSDKQPLGYVSASFGVATYPEDSDSVESLIKASDDTLYEAKEQGRNRVVVANAGRSPKKKSSKSGTSQRQAG